MARERGMTVDVAGFEKLMEEQRARARRARRREVISVSEENLQVEPTKFLGYDFLETEAVVEVGRTKTKNANEFDLIVDRTACYAEMGGQVGDTGLSMCLAPTVGDGPSADREHAEKGRRVSFTAAC